MLSRHHTISEKAFSLCFSSSHFLAFQFVNLATGTALDVAAPSWRPGFAVIRPSQEK